MHKVAQKTMSHRIRYKDIELEGSFKSWNTLKYHIHFNDLTYEL